MCSGSTYGTRSAAENLARRVKSAERHDIELPAGLTKQIATGSGTSGDNFRVVYNGKRYNALSFKALGDRPVAGVESRDGGILGPAVIETTGLVTLVVTGNNLEPAIVSA